MADLDFHPAKAEQQNIGRTTENTLSNAQNEINSTRGTVPHSSKAEIAGQTEKMTKGDNPLLPAFDLTDENQSKQSSASTTNDAKNNSARKEGNKVRGDIGSSSSPSNNDEVAAAKAKANSGKDSSADGKPEPTPPEANNNQSGSIDGKHEPTNSTPPGGSQDASEGVAAQGSDRLTSMPPAATGSASEGKAAEGSDRVTFAPPTSTGNASAAGSPTTSRP